MDQRAGNADGRAGAHREIGDVSRSCSLSEKVGLVDEREKLVTDDKGRKVRAFVEKFASAHDLRRSFGLRWALRVMPAVLMELMRHADIGTTMKYYVGQNAEATADVIWAAQPGFVDTLVDTHPANEKRDAKSTANSSTGERT